VRDAIRGDATMDWLKPFMSGRHFRKGDILFAKGETADEMFCPVTGRYLLLELGLEVKPGQLVGELAMLAPDNRRTATLECIEEGAALSITYEQVEQLYYQNPTFGFYFLRLATARLFENVARTESELTRHQSAQAGSA
jgi:CRP/FNR family transcriptional regulator, cyclic AMP receptor protein